jgi:hypothetical protein
MKWPGEEPLMGRDSRTVPIDASTTADQRSMMHRDKTLGPRRKTWMVVTGRLRLTGWEGSTDEADDPDRRGRESFLSISRT